MSAEYQSPFDSLTRAGAAEEIQSKQKEVRYDLRDFTIDFLVQEFQSDTFYIPDYQRKFIWRPSNKSRFIESVLLGLPIPMMFVAEVDDGRLEIVDGAQRIQTLEEFVNNDLRLAGLEKLESLNNFRYLDLPRAQQRKFGNKALRIVVLGEGTSVELRQEIFDRVNTSGVKARPSEVRRGAFRGPFLEFVEACADDEAFRSLCPISDGMRDRREGEELVLRFFAFSDSYTQFKHDVRQFLDDYVKENRNTFDKARLSRPTVSLDTSLIEEGVQHGGVRGKQETWIEARGARLAGASP